MPSTATPVDLRPFISWVINTFEPAMRAPGFSAGAYVTTIGQTTAELYGIAGMASVLYTLGRLNPSLADRQQWAQQFASLQVQGTGHFLDRKNVHSPLHNTATVLAGMRLLGLQPRYPFVPLPAYADPAAFLATQRWKTHVYASASVAASLCAVYALLPHQASALGTPAWFEAYFSALETYLEPSTGLLAPGRPFPGDSDGVGGTFQYFFLYQYFNRRLPHPEKRIDAILALQLPDGSWEHVSPLWQTFDSTYILTRTHRHQPHRTEDVRTAVRKALGYFMKEVLAPQSFKIIAGPHVLDCVISMLAECQQFLGREEVITDYPLHPSLDIRPFI